MEQFVHVSYGLYQGYGNVLPPLDQPGLLGHKQPDWKQNVGPPTFLSRPGLLVPANASDYCMDPYKRTQLKAILAQMNPSLKLQLCKPNTREVGVQANPRVDKSVQCSLGPRTLHSCSPRASTGHRLPPEGWEACLPMTSRKGLIRLQVGGSNGEGEALCSPVKTGQQRSPKLKSEEQQKKVRQPEELGVSEATSPQEGKNKPPPDLLQKPNFQFLEPKYGYFHCKDCKTRWESAYVWCIAGTNKVYFKQLCCKCQKSFNPYRVEAIQCQTCSKSRCSCPQKKRHADLTRPHRQELCGRCKDKKFSCGNIYSFKYIV
ncbi:ZAR1-like protein [Ochotona curzoniae]|uniref:ZAR1-like protein n=1 Tax=Ochotona curzoniae TaxID=130825 RepID=UPI001B34C311|nr:ZAR1-like protein [Ochotona curzoniae]